MNMELPGRAVAGRRGPVARRGAVAPREAPVPRRAPPVGQEVPGPPRVAEPQEVAAAPELPVPLRPVAQVQSAEHREPVEQAQSAEHRGPVARPVERREEAARRQSAAGPEAVGQVAWLLQRVRLAPGAAWSQPAAVSRPAGQSGLADCLPAVAQSHPGARQQRAGLGEPLRRAAPPAHPARPRQAVAGAPVGFPGRSPPATRDSPCLLCSCWRFAFARGAKLSEAELRRGRDWPAGRGAPASRCLDIYGQHPLLGPQ